MRKILLAAIAFGFYSQATLANPQWHSFMGGESCAQAVSIDGDLAAFTEDERTGRLCYFDFGSQTKYDTGLTGSNPSIRGQKIAYYSFEDRSHIYLYDIPTGQVTDTGVTTAKQRWGYTQTPGRNFSGAHVVFVDTTDEHVKYYSLSNGTITDTGIVGAWPTMDGSIIAFEVWGESTAWLRNVAFYDISTGQLTVLERGEVPVVCGNIIAFRAGGWGAELKYYLIDTGQVLSTGLGWVMAYSTDGKKIAVNPRRSSIVVYDVDTGIVEDTGLRACSSSEACWLDISGDTIVFERYERGTDDGYGNLIYPPEDLNGDGHIGWECVAGWAKISSSPADMIETLIDWVSSLNVQAGIENSLDAKLDAAATALDDVNTSNNAAAIGALSAFVNATYAQRGHNIPEADADALIEFAEQIIAVLSSP